ncbi:MAG: bacteriohopanetetrol glucosamine biosynthesis glycosyltransferase HpnI [Chloracidobacterium sp.]|nr:bacteriohopanetetrol glucosamine biosynthesis glycosyltransferase HpnI [Chloracidobacterium sp.]MDW8218660.1 bacteriohopanetetrol glucosamine biosynthesis glycosyltransferase HpnI [Acidobacteriota bacterium]
MRLAPWLFTLLALLVVASCAYQLVVLAGTIWFRRLTCRERRASGIVFTPPVSLLKPIRGADADTEACLESFFRQDYPHYEIVFALHDPSDPAVPIIERLKQTHPTTPVTCVFRPPPLGVNPKVVNLANALEAARHDTLILSDADIRVPRDYMRTVVRPLQNPQVGVVTCLYRGVNAGGLPSRLECLGVSTDFIGGVLAARITEGLSFAFGATIATRKSVIAAFGGLARLADHLGDDYLLGNLAHRAGYEVRLSSCVVETVVPRMTWREFLSHQLRWARTIRTARFGGYVGLAVTHTFALGMLLVAAFPTITLAWALALIGLALRFLTAWQTARLLGDQATIRNLGWLPLRDLLHLAVWIGGLWGRTVTWHGQIYRLADDGKLSPPPLPEHQ